MIAHLARLARVFSGRAVVVTWCGLNEAEPMMFEAALATCEGCLAARTEALHQVKGGAHCGHRIINHDDFQPERACVRAPGHPPRHTDGEIEW